MHATVLTSASESSLAMSDRWDLHMFSLPQSMDAFIVHCSVSLRQQLMNSPGVESRTLTGKLTTFAVGPTRLRSLFVMWLTQIAAGTTLRDSFCTNGYVWQRLWGDVVQVLPVFLGSILEPLHIESLIGNPLLQTCGLFLHSNPLLGHLWFCAIAIPPPVVLRLVVDF